MPIWLAKIVATRIIKAVKHKIDLKRIDNLEKKFKKLEKTINGGKKKMKKIKERF